ncbi:MAG: hypothetical protein RBR71_13875 [Gudongella sp.]|nr:hypothetical protein [Gudongella sp.]
MKISKNKYIQNIIVIILVIVLLFNTTLKPMAIALELGIAVKVFAVILTSMGILTVINDNGGVTNFYEGFKEFMQTQKDISDTQLRLYQMGITSIFNNAKMKVTFWVSSIKEFYDIFKQSLNTEYIETPLQDLIFVNQLTYTAVTRDLVDSLRNEIHDLGGGYTIKIGSRAPGAPAILYFKYQIYYNNSPILTPIEIPLYSIDIDAYYSNQIRLTYMIQVSDVMTKINFEILNMTTNTVETPSTTMTYESLVGLRDLPKWQDNDIFIPKVETVPNNITFPWEKLQSISGYFGDTVNNLIESISALEIGTLVAELENLGKLGLDASVPPIIIPVDGTLAPDGTITGDTVVEDIKVQEPTIADITGMESVGILGGILALLDKLFNVEPEELNFEPLKNLIILDKFPFSLPWDLKYMVESLKTNNTVAPTFNIDFPIVVSALGWSQDIEIDVDFEQYTPVANILKTMLSITFVIGLIILTRRFIGGA